MSSTYESEQYNLYDRLVHDRYCGCATRKYLFLGRPSFTGTSVVRREYSIRLQDAADILLSRIFEYHTDLEAQRLLL